jgi:hypothetical protein
LPNLPPPQVPEFSEGVIPTVGTVDTVGGRGGIGDYFAFVVTRTVLGIRSSVVETVADRTRVSVSAKAGAGLVGTSASIRAERQTLQDGRVSASVRTEAGTVGVKGEATIDVRVFGPRILEDSIRGEASVSLGIVGVTATVSNTGLTVAAKVGPQFGFAFKSPVTGGVGVGDRVDVVDMFDVRRGFEVDERTCNGLTGPLGQVGC